MSASNITTTPKLSPDQKAFIIITGASRGIGQAVAIELAAFVAPESHFVLIARDGGALAETRAQLGRIANVRCVAMDLADPTEQQLNDVFLPDAADAFDVAVIVHNVGTIGDITLAADACSDAAVWQRYYAINVFSVARLNVRFLQHFDGLVPEAKATAKFVINVTSKCSWVPYASFTMYCTSRAAREMYFKVLAIERTDVSVLNYSPGVVDTAMTVDVQERSANPELRTAFREMRDGAQMLRPLQTAAQLVRLLRDGGYGSGDRVDYYELLDKKA